jgi:hypothetical protein
MSTADITFEDYDSFNAVDDGEPFVDGPPDYNGQYDAGEGFTNLPQCPTDYWDRDCGDPGVGTAAEVVQYTVNYDWQVMTPFMAPFFGDNGTVALKASIVIRNEPWDAVEGEEE